MSLPLEHFRGHYDETHPWRWQGDGIDDKGSVISYESAKKQRRDLSKWWDQLQAAHDRSMDEYNAVALNAQSTDQEISDVQMLLSLTAEPLNALSDDIVRFDRLIAKYERAEREGTDAAGAGQGKLRHRARRSRGG